MKRVICGLEQDWVENIRKEYGNPIRRIENFFSDNNINFIKSNRTTIEVQLEERDFEEILDLLAKFICDTFKEKNAWKILSVNGDIEGLEDIIREKKQGIDVSDEESLTTERFLEGEVVPDKREDEQKLEREEQQEEKKGKKEETQESIFEDERQRILVKQICEMPVIKNAPVMVEYIQELTRVIPMLSYMNTKECIWSRNLLVSIDDGFGYTTFLQQIANVFDTYELIDRNNQNGWVQETVIAQQTKDENRYRDWEKAVACAKSFAEGNKVRTRYVILSFDIREWQSELQTEKVRKYLKEICEYSKNFLCVFRIPHTELSVMTQICDIIADVTTIKALNIAGASMQNMVEYIKYSLRELKYTCDENCDEYLEQWILKEKSDDCFYGYKTLDKMIQEIVYRKALLNTEQGVVSYELKEDDMRKMFDSDEEVGDAYEMLNKLIGLATVKQNIHEIVTQIKVQKDLANLGKEIDRPCIHMMFTGAPGTGKTTVARILSQILKQEGVLRKGHFFEIHGRTLCGRYIGETSPRTSAFCRDAYGSVLFIDEAYSLMNSKSDRDYGKEAIQTLLTEMENHRDDFCVILAGYKDEMNEMMEENTGLRSRIPYEIEFPNYSREELGQIFFALLEGKFEYEEELKETAKAFFDSIPSKVLESDQFSNGRIVRNIFERVWGKAAYRTRIEGKVDILIRKGDFEAASRIIDFQELANAKEKRKIGFSNI